MYSGDKVFYGLKLSKNKIFKLLLNYICTNELQNTIYNHELFKKTYTIYKDLDEINKIFINNINLDDDGDNDDQENNQNNDDDNDNDNDNDDDNDNDEDYNLENDYIIDSEDNIDDNYYNEENKILLSIYELIKDEGDDNDLHNMILLLLKILSFKYLTLLTPSFYEENNEYNNDFLGIELGYNDITHHYIIYKYKNFNNYYNNYMNNIRIMKNKMKRNKQLYDNEFNKLIDIKPRIYSMANDL
jgi:hypothetical protein